MLLCSWGSWNVVTCREPFSLFSCSDGCQWGYGLEQFYNLMEAKSRAILWPSCLAVPAPWPVGPQLCCPPFAIPRPVFSPPWRRVWLCAARRGGRECEHFNRVLEERAVCCWLSLHIDIRAPVLTGAVRLPRVRNQHLWKLSVGFYFSR